MSSCFLLLINSGYYCVQTGISELDQLPGVVFLKKNKYMYVWVYIYASISLQHIFTIPSQFKLPIYNTLYFTHFIINDGGFKLAGGNILLSNTSFSPNLVQHYHPRYVWHTFEWAWILFVYLRTNFICIFCKLSVNIRGAWHVSVHGVAKSWTGLSNWTT